MLEQRMSIRRSAAKQKQILLEKVEKLKLEGKFTKESMVSLGIIDFSEEDNTSKKRMEEPVMHTLNSHKSNDNLSLH